MTEYYEHDDAECSDSTDAVGGATVADLRDVLAAIEAKAPPALELAERLADATAVGVAAAQATVYDAIDAGVLVEDDTGAFGGVRLGAEYAETPDSADIDTGGAGSSGREPLGNPAENPAPEPDADAADREAAVEALRDVLRFYNERVDDAIADHTEDGEHPDRPTTAREYFTERRGWDDATVDGLLLGWAPPEHVDELVAWLHDRGHSREAILATGAVGETDSGGFYTTFAGRYVLPYYDADGEPAYAIARATGGEGGGAEGYGGHPADYQAGKYAKLRHTDARVPFDEPIYGLDTLADGAHVVVAEGIADAITARELGYAVLSPVARQFKEAHYDPLVDALEAHAVDRVTVVADADSVRSDDAGELEPESIGEAVSAALSPVGAGLRGALNTADALEDRADLDVRVTLPPAPADLENDLDEFVTGPWSGDLAALLRSARPAAAFPEYDDVVGKEPSEAFDAFDAEKYEPTATSADETTAEIRDIYHALDRLDARRVAGRTIVGEWLDDRGDRRHFAPTWAPAGYDGTANFVDRDKWVDMGGRGGRGGPAVMAAIDAGLVRDTECPEAVCGATWWEAVDHLRELGFDIPELEDDKEAEEYDDDPREVSATVDAHRAWEAAGRVTPADVEDDRLAPADEDAFACPACGSEVDAVRAVAVLEGLADGCGGSLGADTYPEAYALARTEYGAPLPRYYTTADAIAEWEAVLDVIGEVGFDHLDEDAIATETTATGDAVGGDAVRAMNPAWRLSESGGSVLVFDSGVVWDADTERVLDVLRFVALDSGLLADATEPLEGEAFTEAYRRARTEYGAPLPRWEPALDGARDLTPQLPPAEELLDAREVDGVGVDALEAAREEVEALIREAASDADTPTVVTALPALGKTTGTIKAARDRPLSYLAPRKELQEQGLDKAAEWGVDAFVLPVFAGERVRDEVLDAAEAYVREHDKTPLRERWSLLEAAVDGADEDVDPTDIFVEDDEEDREEVDLNRATCPTRDGEHGVAWALAFAAARKLGYTPRQIHTLARGLFGAEPPCEHDHGEGADSGGCPYSEAWEEAADAEDPYDLLIGSYTHAHVPSVRTAYDTGPDGDRERHARTVVLDEFVGEAYAHGFDDHADDHARWLASALRADVDDRRDMYEADLFGDEWVRAWLNGEGETVDSVDDALATMGRLGDLFDAREGAATVLDEVDPDLLDTFGLETPLRELVGDGRPAAVAGDLAAALGAVDRHHPAAGVAEWASEAVAEPLERATRGGDATPTVEALDLEELPAAGDLADLVAGAVEAVAEGADGAEGRLRAAVKALRGGREGCEVLAAWADDGYAHPDAHHLLEAIATPTGEDAPENATRVGTSAWAFDDEATEGTTVDVVETGERATVVLDRNGHGARLHNPPARTHAGGEETPLVGLDATGRAELWRVALGEPVETADIHDTPAERAAFLEDALDLRVLRASDRPRYYSGDPGTKDTDGDAALLQAIAEEYAGIDAPRQRGDAPEAVGRPAAITSKGVREVLENDARLDDAVAAWEHFGNLAGANDLGAHRLGAVLGCQHYGDDAIERFAALDAEAVDVSRDGARGGELSYDSDLGDAYLQHMTEDQVMQAILRFARGDSGATVVARTGALREDLPVVGEAQVVETYSDTATEIARAYRRLGRRFTVADVADAVDVSRRQVRRVLAELAEAGYLQRVSAGEGVATVYGPGDQPGAGEVDLPRREDAVDATAGHGPSKEYYTWNVRVAGGETASETGSPAPSTRPVGAPPAPEAVEASGPPG
ncbi:FaeA/PapI family transcriptional regulator [Halobellus ruber]|uniref:Uncharacterized protein n=1 Tax=Halobellus ruber TaxID=2761102 RepID=A0A7J9SMN0_9EURY|nr:FaeA/PapI family transcriptional regulator [Halobellus ruber]MBB6647978.1 hypothetical protein [Halobellus ruber]